jgi:hypothetical protein
MPLNGKSENLSASLIVDFLTTYYSVLPNKPKEWVEMVEGLKQKESVGLLPL